MVMSNQVINPAELVRPSGYSYAVRNGDTVYLGGQTALDADGRIVPGGIVEQFERALGNVLTALREAGGEPRDLTTVTIYLTDVDDYQRHGREIGRVWQRLVGDWYPAMAGIGVTKLWQAEALVEVQGVAVVAGA